jgi:hypothetical protein
MRVVNSHYQRIGSVRGTTDGWSITQPSLAATTSCARCPPRGTCVATFYVRACVHACVATRLQPRRATHASHGQPAPRRAVLRPAQFPQRDVLGQAGLPQGHSRVPGMRSWTGDAPAGGCCFQDPSGPVFLWNVRTATFPASTRITSSSASRNASNMFRDFRDALAPGGAYGEASGLRCGAAPACG